MFNEFDFKIFSLILKGTPKEIALKGLIIFLVISLFLFKKNKLKNNNKIVNNQKGNNNIQVNGNIHIKGRREDD